MPTPTKVGLSYFQGFAATGQQILAQAPSHPKLSIVSKEATGDTDGSIQVSDCIALLSQGAKILIIAPVNASNAALQTLIATAQSQKVRIISFDRLIQNAAVDYYISFDNTQIGVLQAQYLLTRVPTGNYIVLHGDPNDPNSTLFYDGAMSILHPQISTGHIAIRMDQAVMNWSDANAYNLMSQALSTAKSSGYMIDAVLAPNDGTAGGYTVTQTGINGTFGVTGGCIQAMIDAGSTLIPITGQDGELAAVQRVAFGKQTMTIPKYCSRDYAEAALTMADQIASGEAVTVDAVTSDGTNSIPSRLIAPAVIDGTNLGTLVAGGSYTHLQVYGN